MSLGQTLMRAVDKKELVIKLAPFRYSFYGFFAFHSHVASFFKFMVANISIVQVATFQVLDTSSNTFLAFSLHH